jgi:hypothetical protein
MVPAIMHFAVQLGSLTLPVHRQLVSCCTWTVLCCRGRAKAEAGRLLHRRSYLVMTPHVDIMNYSGLAVAAVQLLAVHVAKRMV